MYHAYETREHGPNSMISYYLQSDYVAETLPNDNNFDNNAYSRFIATVYCVDTRIRRFYDVTMLAAHKRAIQWLIQENETSKKTSKG
jgi:hypothetical protein